MHLIYKNETIELESNSSSSLIMKKITELIEQDEIIFSHLIIDDVEVYENFESYINERLNEIKRIEIITKSARELFWDILESVKGYLERAIPALKDLTDNSYKNFSFETWQGLSDLSEGFEWMYQFKTTAHQLGEKPQNWNKFKQKFEKIENMFSELLKAMEVKDTVLILDILNYEIIPSYELLLESTIEMLQNKEYYDNVN